MRIIAIAIITIVVTAAVASAQSDRGLEAGVAIGAIDFNSSVGEKPFATALRVGWRFSSWLGLETELMLCPENPSGNFGQRIWLVGPKVGMRVGSVELHGKVRGGQARFGGRAFRAYNTTARVEPAVNFGALVEFWYSTRVALRIDGGVTLVPFGSEQLRGPLPPYATTPGLTRSGEGMIGMQFRF
jgi:hypothetical protein